MTLPRPRVLYRGTTVEGVTFNAQRAPGRRPVVVGLIRCAIPDGEPDELLEHAAFFPLDDAKRLRDSLDKAIHAVENELAQKDV